MKEEEITQVILNLLKTVAPDTEPKQLKPDD
ncbi:MAG: phosphopantetheine-binding protein, partial [Marivirga sp.]|nr:phosphopantetheine-binding protein [Marivirga sp.]